MNASPEACSIRGFYIAMKMDDILTSTDRKQLDKMKNELLNRLNRYSKCFDPDYYTSIRETIKNIDLYNIKNVRTNSPLNDIFNSIYAD